MERCYISILLMMTNDVYKGIDMVEIDENYMKRCYELAITAGPLVKKGLTLLVSYWFVTVIFWKKLRILLFLKRKILDMHVFEWWGGEHRPLEELIAEMDEVKN